MRAAGKRVTVADPEDVCKSERRRQQRLQKYFADRGQSTPRDTRGELPWRGAALAEIIQNAGTEVRRQIQAAALSAKGLLSKAHRFAMCARIGKRWDHKKESRTNCRLKFYQVYCCGLRYCAECGPKQGRALFMKLLKALTPTVESMVRLGAVVAKVDFTVLNDGRMPTPAQVKEFHKDMGRFWRAAEARWPHIKGRYGLVRQDEFGGNNTNLHAHCAYVGPWLPQKNKELSALWAEIRGDGSFIVSVKRAGKPGWSAGKCFADALSHAMKYPLKFIKSSSPQRLAELEATFHTTRRISTLGLFYRVPRELREPGADSRTESGTCPCCHAQIVAIQGWCCVNELRAEGRVTRDEARQTLKTTIGLRKALGDKPPP